MYIHIGKNHAGIYCNDDQLEAHAVESGKLTGDLVFPLPYCPEFYRAEFRSQVRECVLCVRVLTRGCSGSDYRVPLIYMCVQYCVCVGSLVIYYILLIMHVYAYYNIH